METITLYVIRSIEGYTYTGVTEDLKRRLQEHNDRSLSFWTRRGTGWRLIYKEEFASKAEALKREKWLKTGAGRDFVKQQIGE